MKTLRRADIAAGCFLSLLGLFVLYTASSIRVGVERALSPRTFPFTIGFLIFFCGIGLAVKSWRFRGEDIKIQWPDREGMRINLGSLIILAIYIFLMNPLGVLLGTFLHVTGLIFGFISRLSFVDLSGKSFPAVRILCCSDG